MKFLSRLLLAPLARLIFRPRVVGRRNVPKRGGVLLASNHFAFIDSVVITLVAPRSVSFMAKAEYFTGHGFRGRLSRAFFRGVGAVPVDRSSSRAAQDALDAGLDVLRAGEAFSIYPEGTRSRDGRLYRGRTGVAWLALTAGVPVVPVALAGTDRLQPGGTGPLRPARVTVQFGEPLDLSVYGPATSGRARREATDAVMAAIHEMSGQQLAGEYNEPPPTTVRERAARVFRRERV
ncbi:1-acyl-sn-glycerol-3-phosphate acyltransferase [Salinibacterium sp. SYSU T00001]|uniref:lysophospholipid acyltransferase family protein n=1 Tax=Homoserinimonas sedimenticola TaxID=2986805 RepID=UPI0022368435|nr:lysophospholipid acyltransferase family protein [Salinibacterium sedimenticola]MCW4385458.1 1-acyl-sn-glycerol-3-phosphate acyltransferase [Salinibacterium sedimenticola]